MRSGVKTDGAEVVVVGRSNIVGKPIANMLLQKAQGANATVTVCHTATRDMAFHTGGRTYSSSPQAGPRPSPPTWSRRAWWSSMWASTGLDDPEGKAKLAGDVDFDAVKEKASFITPVPGGVGPMTITMLMLIR